MFKRIDMTSRSLIALIEPGSCFAGTLAELLFAADRSVMLRARAVATIAAGALHLSPLNFGAYPMGNGSDAAGDTLPRRTRQLRRMRAQRIGRDAATRRTPRRSAWSPSPTTTSDWDDEVRLMLEERASFSPDALTAMEANLRFAGPETMETRIFGRLTAWQNWIFQRPNAVGDEGSLKRYGSGAAAELRSRSES